MEWKEVFKPRVSAIILALIISINYFFITSLRKICSASMYMCESGKYAARVPFSCDVACTSSEYFIELMENIFPTFILPLLVSYILLSPIIDGIKRVRNRR